MSIPTKSSKLEVAARGDREVAMVRVFPAPKRAVYAAWTQPGRVVHWYGPAGWTMPVCLIDLRVGGVWRYVMKGPDGTPMEISGGYREVIFGERVVSTESVDGTPGGSLNTTTLLEHDGQTTLTAVVRYDTPETRDAVLASRLEAGAGASFDRYPTVPAEGTCTTGRYTEGNPQHIRALAWTTPTLGFSLQPDIPQGGNPNLKLLRKEWGRLVKAGACR